MIGDWWFIAKQDAAEDAVVLLELDAIVVLVDVVVVVVVVVPV